MTHIFRSIGFFRTITKQHSSSAGKKSSYEPCEQKWTPNFLDKISHQHNTKSSLNCCASHYNFTFYINKKSNSKCFSKKKETDIWRINITNKLCKYFRSEFWKKTIFEKRCQSWKILYRNLLKLEKSNESW
jgi:hypothetical protein